MGGCHSQNPELPSTSENTNEGEDRLPLPVLRLNGNMLAFAIASVVAVAASYVTTKGGPDMITALPPPPPHHHHTARLTPLDAFGFSIIGVFCPSLVTSLLSPHFPTLTKCLEGLSVLSTAAAFASLVSIFLQARFRCVVYATCMASTLPLLQGPYRHLHDAFKSATPGCFRRDTTIERCRWLHAREFLVVVATLVAVLVPIVVVVLVALLVLVVRRT